METVTKIIDVVAAAAPEIRGGLTGRRRKADEENPSGEIQMAADVWADEYLESELTAIDGVGEFASEEREAVVDCGDGLSVAIDPLDGSSNLKSNNSMGTIVGIYDAPLPARGTDLVASAFVLFGPITTMMVARDDSVTEYVIEDSAVQGTADKSSGETPRDGEHRVVTEDVTLPDDPTVYGFGGRVPDWPEAFTAYARGIEDELKLRYGGAMIGDVNQVLTYGGVFAYPGLESRPEGKLRLQFEGNPMAYIIESAGGRSSDGEKSILEVTPERLHQRVPLHIGNANLIERLEAAL